MQATQLFFDGFINNLVVRCGAFPTHTTNQTDSFHRLIKLLLAYRYRWIVRQADHEKVKAKYQELKIQYPDSYLAIYDLPLETMKSAPACSRRLATSAKS